MISGITDQSMKEMMLEKKKINRYSPDPCEYTKPTGHQCGNDSIIKHNGVPMCVDCFMNGGHKLGSCKDNAFARRKARLRYL